MKKVILLMFFFMGTCELVYSQPMTINVERNLTFNDVFGGQQKEVTIYDDNSALFRLDVRGNNHTFRVSFTLTSVLTNGAHTIPVTYDLNQSSWKLNSNNPVGSTFFNPFGNFTVNVNNRDVIYVWIGGIVNPTVSDQHGNYTANIVISVEKL